MTRGMNDFRENLGLSPVIQDIISELPEETRNNFRDLINEGIPEWLPSDDEIDRAIDYYETSRTFFAQLNEYEFGESFLTYLCYRYGGPITSWADFACMAAQSNEYYEDMGPYILFYYTRDISKMWTLRNYVRPTILSIAPGADQDQGRTAIAPPSLWTTPYEPSHLQSKPADFDQSRELDLVSTLDAIIWNEYIVHHLNAVMERSEHRPDTREHLIASNDVLDERIRRTSDILLDQYNEVYKEDTAHVVTPDPSRESRPEQLAKANGMLQNSTNQQPVPYQDRKQAPPSTPKTGTLTKTPLSTERKIKFNIPAPSERPISPMVETALSEATYDSEQSLEPTVHKEQGHHVEKISVRRREKEKRLNINADEEVAAALQEQLDQEQVKNKNKRMNKENNGTTTGNLYI